MDTGDITLPTIPRASTISASINHEAGDSIPVTINRASSSFTHDLVFKVGNTTIKTLTGIATSATFTFTNSEVGAIVRAISGTSSSAQIVCTTKNGSTIIGSAKTVSGTVRKTPSKITANLNKTLGSNPQENVSFSVSISRQSAGYTHNLTLKAGNTILRTANNVGTSYTFNVATWELYNACPDSYSKTMSLTCITQRGTTEIGQDTPSYGTLTLQKALCRPTLATFEEGCFTYYDANSKTSALVSGSTEPSQIIVDGYSDIHICIPANKLAYSLYGATIQGYKLTIGSQMIYLPHSTTGQSVEGTLFHVKDERIQVEAVDSRGNSSIASTNTTLIPYHRPVISSSTLSRENQIDAKTFLKLDLNWYNSPIGITDNTLWARYSYKKTTESDQSWKGPYPISLSSAGNTSSYDGVINGDLDEQGFDADTSFDILIECGDVLDEAEPIKLLLDRGIPTLHLTQKGLAIGKLADSDTEGLDVNMPTRLRKEMSVDQTAAFHGVTTFDGETNSKGYVYFNKNAEGGKAQGYIYMDADMNLCTSKRLYFNAPTSYFTGEIQGNSIDCYSINASGEIATTVKGSIKLSECFNLGEHSQGITQYTNLNNFKTAGTYGCYTDAVARTLYNCPLGYAFKLTVNYVLGNTTYLIQRYESYRREVFTRQSTNGGSTWSEWTYVEGPPVLLWSGNSGLMDNFSVPGRRFEKFVFIPYGLATPINAVRYTNDIRGANSYVGPTSMELYTMAIKLDPNNGYVTDTNYQQGIACYIFNSNGTFSMRWLNFGTAYGMPA